MGYYTLEKSASHESGAFQIMERYDDHSDKRRTCGVYFDEDEALNKLHELETKHFYEMEGHYDRELKPKIPAEVLFLFEEQEDGHPFYPYNDYDKRPTLSEAKEFAKENFEIACQTKMEMMRDGYVTEKSAIDWIAKLAKLQKRIKAGEIEDLWLDGAAHYIVMCSPDYLD